MSRKRPARQYIGDAAFCRNVMMRFGAALFAFLFGVTNAAAEPVDLELVLAMDASASISNREYVLQVQGTAAAFREPDVQSAIRSGPYGRIAVTVMLWSDGSLIKTNSGWHVLSNAASVEQFAQVLNRFRLNDDNSLSIGSGGGTAIGSGVAEALRLITSNQHEGLRRVIDVSGDGPETQFEFSRDIKIGPAGDLAASQGVNINGLPIVTRNAPDLAEYYRREVIAGPGAFVIVAEGFDDFARAIREKLLREIQISIGAGAVTAPNG